MREYTIKNVAVASITKSPLKVHRALDSANITELAASFDEVGFIQPIVVREIGDNQHELLVGEHRLAAAREAKFESIPAIIFSGSDDDAALMSVESDLRVYVPGEEERDLLLARYEELYQSKHGRPKVGRPSKTVARRESFARAAAAASRKDVSTIYRGLARQRKLTDAVREALSLRRISHSHADELAKLPSEQQDEVLEQITDKTRGQAREIVRTALEHSGTGGPEAADRPPHVDSLQGEAEQELGSALAAIRAHQVNFKAQLEPVIDTVRRAASLINADDIEGPDRLLVDILTVIHRLGDVLTDAGNAVQRVRSELRRVVRNSHPESEGSTSGDPGPH